MSAPGTDHPPAHPKPHSPSPAHTHPSVSTLLLKHQPKGTGNEETQGVTTHQDHFNVIVSSEAPPDTLI